MSKPLQNSLVHYKTKKGTIKDRTLFGFFTIYFLRKLRFR